MSISETGDRLRELINRVIDDGIITHEEYDKINTLVFEDGHIDDQERALLKQLQEMIESKMVKFSSK